MTSEEVKKMISRAFMNGEIKSNSANELAETVVNFIQRKGLSVYLKQKNKRYVNLYFSQDSCVNGKYFNTREEAKSSIIYPNRYIQTLEIEVED
jgi:hypothetical protein